MKPTLNRSWLEQQAIPAARVLNFPEKVMQFGTGVLLRALPDHFIHKANLEGVFKGRIVMIKSTRRGDADVHLRQDCLYTTVFAGVRNGEQVKESVLNSSVSRILQANEQWEEVLALASSKDLQVVISNTTEVGLQYVPEDVKTGVPESFPGKLLAVLFARYTSTGGDMNSGLVIIPTELLPDNGLLLKSILNNLAAHNDLDKSFIEWLNTANYFCSSLVDRIVPGKPTPEIRAELAETLPYTDDAMIMAEPYGLWAIEGNAKVRELLSFYTSDPGCIIEEDITVYRELKLRLLNATHTLSCAYAIRAGFDTVIEAMNDPEMRAFIEGMMKEEIAQCIPYDIPQERITSFANEVLDRFSNPYLQHRWLSISVQYSSKMKMRVLPLLNRYHQKFNHIPPRMREGLLAFLEFMTPVRKEGDQYFGSMNGQEYLIDDSNASIFFEARDKEEILSYVSLWGSRIEWMLDDSTTAN